MWCPLSRRENEQPNERRVRNKVLDYPIRVRNYHVRPWHPQKLHTAETSFLLPSGKTGLSVVQSKVITSHVYEMLYVRGLGSGTSNTCPSCFLEGAYSHYLGYCIHKNMVKSHIECYCEAGILILQAISRGRDGNKSYSAHCGTNHNMEKMGAFGTC